MCPVWHCVPIIQALGSSRLAWATESRLFENKTTAPLTYHCFHPTSRHPDLWGRGGIQSLGTEPCDMPMWFGFGSYCQEPVVKVGRWQAWGPVDVKGPGGAGPAPALENCRILQVTFVYIRDEAFCIRKSVQQQFRDQRKCFATQAWEPKFGPSEPTQNQVNSSEEWVERQTGQHGNLLTSVAKMTRSKFTNRCFKKHSYRGRHLHQLLT